MSRLQEIQQEILNAKATAAELNALEVLTTSEQTLNSATSTSKVAIWRLWVYVIAFCIWVHEKIVAKNAENSRPHTIKWYRDQCLNYLDGLALTWKDGQFAYDTTGITDIEERRIIARCAVLESNNGELVIKVARLVNGVLMPLTAAQLARFEAYIKQIKDAGNRIRVINQLADNLKATLNVYVDVSIIDLQTGKLLNTTGDVYPVKDAINNYLANLEFNGAFVKEFFRDELQKAEGVKRPLIDVLQSQYSGFPFSDILDWKVPNAGYFKIDDANLTINYIANDLVGNS